MITAYLIGDQQLLDRLRALPSAANSGLVRGITRLVLDLQAMLQQGSLGGQVLGSRGRPRELHTDLRVEESGGTVTASVSIYPQNLTPQEHGLPGMANVRARLQRNRAAFVRPVAPKAVSTSASNRTANLPERSFLRSVLDSMTPAARDAVEATLTEAVS
jgi:hypothetical protein